MPSLKNFSVSDEEEDNQLCRNSEVNGFNLEAEVEDPEKIDEMEDDDVKSNEEEEEDLEEEEEEEGSKEKSESSESEEEQSDSDLEIFLQVYVELGNIRRDVQCPICLGIIKKTRTVMECLHRFCRECIDKSMRLGNNECPACRKHCASRRSLRDDPNFDTLIAGLIKNIDSFEEEEFAFHEDDEARNKQIQLSIAQVSQRQSEALGKRKSFGKDAAVLPKSQRIGSSSRRRSNTRNLEIDTSEVQDEDDNSNIGKDSSSDDEYQERKRKRRSTSRPKVHPSSSNAKKSNNDNDTEEAPRDSRGISPGLVWNSEMFAWGRGGTRSSNTRHGNNNAGANNRNVRNARLNRLAEYLGSLEGNDTELEIHVKLVSLDLKCLPDLPQPYLCIRPTLLVKQLREFVALQLQLKPEEVELLMTKIENPPHELITSSTEELQSLKDDETLAKRKVAASLKDDETLAKLKVDSISGLDYLSVVYRQVNGVETSCSE